MKGLPLLRNFRFINHIGILYHSDIYKKRDIEHLIYATNLLLLTKIFVSIYICITKSIEILITFRIMLRLSLLTNKE